jgi:hypothetical protein
MEDGNCGRNKYHVTDIIKVHENGASDYTQ